MANGVDGKNVGGRISMRGLVSMWTQKPGNFEARRTAST
ncbi:hypothetical protein X975_04544, partial [Stegodyphus mimosarum]